MHGKVQGTQSAITVHGDGVWAHGTVQEGTGAERDNGARACTGRCMQGTGAASDNGARGRCLGAGEGAGDRGRAR